jgi:hypothetical protein
MRRVAGGGTIEMTQDDGATWTAVSPTSEWSRVSIPVLQVAAGSFVIGKIYRIATVGTTNFTLIGASSNAVGTVFTATGAGSGTGIADEFITDPVVGFRISAKGDIVDIDFVQNETGGFATSPIETKNASVTRSIDNVSMSWTAYPRLLAMRRFTTDVSFVPSQIVLGGTMFDITDGTNSNVLRNNYRVTDFQAGLTVITAGSTIIGLDPDDADGYVVAANTPSRFVASFDMTNNWLSVSMDGSGRNDASVALPRTESSWAPPSTLNKLTMGAQQTPAAPLHGYVRQFTIYNYAMSPELAAQTSKL